MIFVLNNADFSEKNIGHIDFNVPLSEETVAIMNYATKYPKVQENEYAQALNRFINTIKVAGIYSKLSVLVVPSMSNTIDECTKNQLTGVNCLNSTIFKNLFELRNNNLHRKAYQWGDKTDQCGYTIAHSYDDFSMFCFYKAGETKTDAILGTAISGWQSQSNCVRWGSSTLGSVTCGNSAVNKGSLSIFDNTSLDSSAIVLSYGSGTCDIRYNERLYEGTYPVPPARTGQLIKFNPLLLTTSSTASNGELVIFGCGTKLTAPELKTLYDEVKQFSAHFL